MAPVTTAGIDTPVWPVGQLIATVLTFGLAVAVLILVARLCRREAIVWPYFVLISGTLTCLMEPLFDHLYGLWFREQGQWHLYTTFGSHQPIWVPAAYLTFYGGATVFIARALAKRPTMRTVWTMYAFIVVMAVAAEITYIAVLKVYDYQDSQPFVVFGYPIFLGFTNAMSALVSGIVIYRLAPRFNGFAYLYLIPVVPMAFAAGLFGSGILYLSVRHSVDQPPMVLVHLAALTVVGAIASTVGLLGRILVAQRSEADRIA
ncbi:hypothetical protein [Mycobacterium sp. M26]|uniref:hypothetical protein n=1 Tax=Mycobacterium sp. M26 TaxID=1762962 RepID=UPI00073F3897|nr:hypothetical protein [Mycobacterium sp. M26]